MKEKAIGLRKLGRSCSEISVELDVPLSTIKRWVKGVSLTDTQRKFLIDRKWKGSKKSGETRRKNAITRRREWIAEGEKEARFDVWDHAAGCMIWWAEGDKGLYAVKVVNCDPSLLRCFVDFLRKYYGLTDEQFALSVQYHEKSLNKTEIMDFWKSSLGLQTIKSFGLYSKEKKSSKTKHKYGVGRVIVYDTHLAHRLLGSVRVYLKNKELGFSYE